MGHYLTLVIIQFSSKFLIFPASEEKILWIVKGMICYLDFHIYELIVEAICVFSLLSKKETLTDEFYSLIK